MGTKTGLGIGALVVAVVVVVSMTLLERRSVGATPEVGVDAVDAVAVAPEPEISPADRVEVAVQPTASEVSSAPASELEYVVSGLVLGRDGEILLDSRNAHVRFVDELGSDRLERLAPDGSYSASGLAPGRWWILAYATGYRVEERTIDLGELAPSSREDFRLVPQPAVKVKLLAPDGRPFWDAAKPFELGMLGLSMVAVATLEPPGERFEQVRGSLNNPFGVGSMWFNGQNSVELPAAYWGRIDLHAEPPLYISLVLYHDVIETRHLEAGQEDLGFTLDPASIDARLGGVEFTLVDGKTNAPIARAAVMLHEKGGAGPWFASDERGHVRMERVPAGLHDLRIDALDWASVRREVDVPRGHVLDLGTIELSRATPIRGRAVGADGKGLEVEIRVCAVPEPGELPVGTGQYSSKPDGSFEIADLAPGRWLLQVKDRVRGRLQGNAAEQMAPHVLVDTRSGPVDDLLVKLERVTFAVVSWQGDDIEDLRSLRLRFFDRDGLLRQHSGFFSAAPMRVALFPGDWRVVLVDAQGTTLTERAFTLGSEPLVLALAP